MARTLYRFQPKNRHWLLFTFLATLAAAALLFVPFISLGEGVFFYYGDFNVQEIPFYQLLHSQVRSGDLGWNHLTDLGSDTLASYSFYLLGSPFFWLTIPFPNEFVPYLIGPLLILKFACAATAAHLFIQRYVRFKAFAALGGLLYAFSGFSVYNVFFFHFHEPMIVFPLLLAALDAFLYDKRRGVFAVAVFAACVINYYFFVGQVLFLVMYYLMLTLSKTYRFRFREMLLLAAEVLIGFCATAFVLLPSVLGLLGNPRLDDFPNGWGMLVHDKPQRYFLIVFAFLFPADMPAMPTFTPDSNCKWASVAGWLPLFGMTGVFAYLQLRKRDWLKRMLALLALFALVPVLNSMFQLMNTSIFYTRWYYMPVLLMALATVRAVEDRQTDWKRAIIWSTAVTAGAILLVGLMPDITENKDGTEDFFLGVQADRVRFWIYALFAMLCLLGFVLLYKKFFGNRKVFAIASLSAVTLAFLLTSAFIIGYGWLGSGSTYQVKQYVLNARDRIHIDDLEDVRSDFYKCADNIGMFWKVPSINCFQSSVSTSIMQFYQAIGIKRDVASRPDFKAYALRPLFSTKYYFDYTLDNKDKSDDHSFLDKKGNTKMPGYTYLKTNNKYAIYQNDNYIPMGFCFDRFITEEELERVNKPHKPEALLHALVLSREQMERYADITGYDAEAYAPLYGEHPRDFRSPVDSFVYTEHSYTDACKTLAQNSCESFRYTKDGFCAVFDNKGRDNLLLFSIPYSEGFSATVNGEAVPVEKVDFGFMAVRVPGNTKSEIVFTYRTPGLQTGILISLLSLGAMVLYLAAVYTVKFIQKKRGNSHVIRKENP